MNGHALIQINKSQKNKYPCFCPSQLSANNGRFQVVMVVKADGVTGTGTLGATVKPGPGALDKVDAVELSKFDPCPCPLVMGTPCPTPPLVLLLLEPAPFEPFAVPLVVGLAPVGALPFASRLL
jgi:hypothetical protein